MSFIFGLIVGVVFGLDIGLISAVLYFDGKGKARMRNELERRYVEV